MRRASSSATLPAPPLMRKPLSVGESGALMGKKASAPGGTGLQRLVLSRRLTGWPGDGPLLRRRCPAPIPQSRGREVLTDSSGLLECAAAAGGDGRRPGQLGELRRCSAHPCSSGNALGEALVGSRRGGSFRTRYANPRRAAGARRLPAYLRSASRLAPGGVAGCAGLLAKAAVAAARAGLAERGGVGHERGAESSSARALAGPR
jgi:hypothetical protein